MIGRPMALRFQGARRFAAVALAAAALAGCDLLLSGFAIGPFTSADGRFTVTVPDAKMAEQTRPGEGTYAGSTIHFWTGGRPDGPRLAVVYGDATTPDGRSDQEILDAFAQSNVTSTGGTLIEQHAITVHGLAGREERLGRDNTRWIFRLFAVGNRLYSVSVTGSADQVATAHAIVFLDSFEVLP